MEEPQVIEILKKAILFEMRGKSFYSRMARETSDETLQAFFQMMAGEEDQHVQILSQQVRALRDNGQFEDFDVVRGDQQNESDFR